jgi:hypothetical protein
MSCEWAALLWPPNLDLQAFFFIYQRYQSIGGDELTMQVRLLASIASLTCHLFDSGECCASGGDRSVESDFEC